MTYKKVGGIDSHYPAQATNLTLRQCQLPSTAPVRCRVQNARTGHDRQTGHLNHGKPSASRCPAGRAICEYHYAEVIRVVEIAVRLMNDVRRREIQLRRLAWLRDTGLRGLPGTWIGH